MKLEERFPLGTTVRKISGPQWQGVVVGYYSSSFTPEGLVIECTVEGARGQVHVEPAKRMELLEGATTSKDELIAALEKATGPDRELDKAIARAIGFFDGTRSSYDLQLNLIPKYSASIDASLTLFEDQRGPWSAWNEAQRHMNHVIAPTPALAICIAALRARKVVL